MKNSAGECQFYTQQTCRFLEESLRFWYEPFEFMQESAGFWCESVKSGKNIWDMGGNLGVLGDLPEYQRLESLQFKKTNAFQDSRNP